MIQRTFGSLALLALAIGLIATVAEAQTTVYVDDGAGEDNNGVSWEMPFNYLEDALAWAREHPIITEIHVAGGVYVPSVQSEAGVPRTETFQLINGVAIYGGYAGLADPGDPDVRDLQLYESVLTGDLSGDDTSVACTEDSPDCDAYGKLCVDGFCSIKANNDENCYHVVDGSGVDATAVLAGFTITGGNADGSSPHEHGGGIRIIQQTGSPTIEHCRIVRNCAEFGGGVSCEPSSTAAFVHCTISENAAGQYGGALFIALASSPTLTGCTIAQNTAPHGGGGVYCGDNSNPTLSSCLITGNRTIGPPGIPGGGGGISCVQSSPEIADCLIVDNAARWQGGGISCRHNADPTIAHTVIMGNSAYDGGGVFAYDSSSPVIEGCIIRDNTVARQGGGICIWSNGSPTISNCTIARNTGTSLGGAMYLQEGSADVVNCILWGNTAAQGSEIFTVDSTPTVTYCCVHGGYGGEGNHNADPRFQDPDGPDDVPGTDDDDFRLRLVSPCIDVGDNMAVPPGVSTDLAGNPRFIDAPNTPDTGSGVSLLVDMGAYEFQPLAQGDLDGDGDVDLSDFRMFMENYGGPLLMR